MTIFRGALEERGLPEEIRGSSQEQQQLWQYGSTLAQLASQAGTLAALADKDSADALSELSSTLNHGSMLVGQLSFEDQPTVPLEQSFSPEAVSKLAGQVAELSTQLPVVPEEQASLAPVLTQLAFQTNLEARSALRTVAKQELVDQLPVPLIAGESHAEGETVGCLREATLLNPETAITDPALRDDVRLARALDRGYALDYTLQLQAARGSNADAAKIEGRRTTLNAELRKVRSVLPEDCADLRQPAYVLPEDGLNDLGSLAAEAEDDFVQALALASGAATDSAQDTLAELTWQILLEQRQRGLDPELLNAGE
ncbi:hypothetical protein [Glutamicibacter arilaitensis]|uniref:hypothetical protein n=1 Tax=Glutamicibacter arilaitensis TaxID=256701 RepID=UPI00384E11C4